MSIKFDLAKQTERVQFVLTKRNLPQMRASVGITLDVSGSIKDLYMDGTIQRVVEQLVPIGLKFDDNGNLDTYVFSDGDNHQQVGDGATATNYSDYVEKEILDNSDVSLWGGTSYSPVIKSLLEDYGFFRPVATIQKVKKAAGFFATLLGIGDTDDEEDNTPASYTLQPHSTSGEAVLNYFITDGEANDHAETRRLLKAAQDAKANIYFLFIGVGSENFNFLKQIAKDYSNVGFLGVSDLQKFADSDDIYEKLLPSELTDWLIQKKV